MHNLKIYIKPEVKVIDLYVEQPILTGSGPEVASYNDDPDDDYAEYFD